MRVGWLVVLLAQPLGIESAPLVQHLLQDIILTTTNYEELRQRGERAEQDRDVASNQAGALRKEYSRVTRENNQLHLGMIQAAEKLDEQRAQWEARERKRAGELGDMRFLCEYQKSQIDKLVRCTRGRACVVVFVATVDTQPRPIYSKLKTLCSWRNCTP